VDHAERTRQATDFVQHIAPLNGVLTNLELGGCEQMRATDGNAVRDTASGE
jgi:hypothetical protein